MDTAIALPQQDLRPSYQHRLTAADMKADLNLILQVMSAVMEPNKDYGLITGCGPKPTLLKPGAEKLTVVFRLAPEPMTEDLSGPDEIRYRIKIVLTHFPTGNVVGYGVGEASSNEEKYKWRKVVSSAEWDATPEDRRRLKFYADGSAKQIRTNPSDVANTVLKMAKKRALVDGALTATAASSVFSQDLEDLSDEMRQAVAEADQGVMPPVATPKAKEATPAAAQATGGPAPAPVNAAPANGAPKLDKSKMRRMQSKIAGGTCRACKNVIDKGAWIYFDGDSKGAYHEACA